MAADGECCLLPAEAGIEGRLRPRSARSRWTLRRLRNPRMQACRCTQTSESLTDNMESKTRTGRRKLAWMYDDAP